MHGAGTYELPAGGGSYSGSFRRNAFHGQGQLRLADGSVYAGGFAAHKFEGAGRLEAAGEVYEGDWAAGARCGRGTCTYANGDRYEVRGDSRVRQSLARS